MATNPFIIHVDQIDEPRQPWRHTLSKTLLEEIFADAPGWKVRAPSDFTAHLTKLGESDVLLEGKAVLQVESDCRRCLTSVPTDVPVAFTLSMVSRNKNLPGLKEEEDTGEGEGAGSFDEVSVDEEYFNGEKFDLQPILREQLLLALPAIEPLCKESCKGLCTTCGQNLNEKDCGHSQTPPDPRWEALKNLKV